MGTIAVHPLTLVGIKRLATAIKRKQGVSHALALDQAARAANFQNFRHARKELANARVRLLTRLDADNPLRVSVNGEKSLYRCFITAYWWDEEEGTRGRETLFLEFHKPLAEIISSGDVRARILGNFKLDAVDHLEARDPILDQLTARDAVCKVARRISFMACTALKAKRGRRVENSIERLTQHMAGIDHASKWVNPATGIEVLCDEPYKENLLDQRRPWLANRGLHIVKPLWAGMYSPGNATPYLVSSDHALLEYLKAQLEAAEIVHTSENWTGVSAPYKPIFISPGRKASGVIKRPIRKPVVAGQLRNGALPYSIMPSGRTAWRPASRLPLNSHIELASILKPLIDTYPPLVPRTVSSPLMRIRCDLDDWVQREYTREEIPDEVFNILYYGGDRGKLPPQFATPAAAILRAERLIANYNDCTPARALERALKVAQKHLSHNL